MTIIKTSIKFHRWRTRTETEP